ncbi:MAG: hypothetical protein GY850_42570 [bacterium]|nr:hypothetical protein [bacterium]
MKKTGQRRRFSSRDLDYRKFVFKMKEAPNSQQTYYLRFQGEEPMFFSSFMWSEIGFYSKVSRDRTFLGFFYGILFATAIYNLFLFLSLRERYLLYYVASLISILLLFFAIDGLAFQYLWPNMTDLARYSTSSIQPFQCFP